jgi:hypothetical protein
MLLWALGAVAGWWLLRDWPQLAFSALLIPFWLIGEWAEAVRIGAFPVVAIFCTLLAISYLSVPIRELRWIGGISLIPSVLVLTLSNWSGFNKNTAPGTLGVVGWVGAFLLPLGFAFLYRRTATWMNAVAAVWVGVLSALTLHHATLGIFAGCAVGSACMIAWGIHEFRTERVNLGMAGFAITLIVFYFSNVMDKLDRSTSLIVLGILFLVGAWYWEKLRRKLVARVNAGGLTGGAA